ncbi:hypothetical protein [Archangium sp.]|jgi:hypothetical protein|uniref:hypothetical protein n=1 Tax=Archangium sp. TaxID=1872627 RepID=UPI002EDA9B21
MSDQARTSKELCDELSALLEGPDAATVGKLLHFAEARQSPSGAPPPFGPPMPPRGEGPQAIGPWRPEQRNGEVIFVREEPNPLRERWGSVRAEIPARKASADTVRVCLIGESVGTGLHYAPEYSVGHVLQGHLDTLARRKGAGRFEVVDLSVNGMARFELMALFEAALQLQPDVFVVLAGNNFTFMMPRSPSEEARAAREGGYQGLLEYGRGVALREVDTIFDTLGDVARRAGTRVIFGVPVANHRDFATRQPVAWLPGDATPRWHELFERAEEAQRRGEHTATLELARQLVELDGRTCASSLRLLGTSLMALGREEEGRAALEAEVEAAVQNPWFAEVPRIAASLQDTIRRVAARQGFAVVDLPALLSEWTGKTSAGRETLLDSCHFEGGAQRLVTAALALEVARPGGSNDVLAKIQALADEGPKPTAEFDASVKFASAMSNASANDALAPVIGHWLEEALRLWPGMAEVIVDHMEMTTAPCPPFLTRAYARMKDRGYKLYFPFPGAAALSEILAVFRRRAPEKAAAVEQILQRHLGLDASGVDLSQQQYCLDWGERFMADWALGIRSDERTRFSRGTNLRAPWSRSRFFAIHDGRSDVHLNLVARLPEHGARREGMVAVSVNGVPVGEVAIGTAWTKHELVAKRELWKPGTNVVAVRWPMVPAAGEQPLADFIDRRERALPANPFPVFGELYHLVARTSGK